MFEACISRRCARARAPTGGGGAPARCRERKTRPTRLLAQQSLDAACSSRAFQYTAAATATMPPKRVLCVAEKPSVAKDLANMLSRGTVCLRAPAPFPLPCVRVTPPYLTPVLRFSSVVGLPSIQRFLTYFSPAAGAETRHERAVHQQVRISLHDGRPAVYVCHDQRSGAPHKRGIYRTVRSFIRAVFHTHLKNQPSCFQ